MVPLPPSAAPHTAPIHGTLNHRHSDERNKKEQTILTAEVEEGRGREVVCDWCCSSLLRSIKLSCV